MSPGKKRLALPVFETEFRNVPPAAHAEIPRAPSHVEFPRHVPSASYHPRAAVEWLVDGDRRLLLFASSSWGDFAIDISTGAVVLRLSSGNTLYVNGTLDQFRETTKRTIDRLPYYDHGASLEERERVGRELLDMIKEIDPEAAISDRYWSTFVDDVVIGDFAREFYEVDDAQS
jgi:hypothetical protein